MSDYTTAMNHLHKYLLNMSQDPVKAKSQLFELIRVCIEEEREACAKTAEKVSENWSKNNDEYKAVALMCAEEIRKRR